jgi:hypothetical protein
VSGLRFAQVNTSYWRDEKVRRWSPAGKLLGVYLLAGPHATLEGLYGLPRAYVAADLGLSTQEVDDAFAEVLAAGFAEYDSDAEVVFVCRRLKYHTPSGAKSVTGAINAVEAVPTSPLFGAWALSADRYASEGTVNSKTGELVPSLAEALRKRWPDRDWPAFMPTTRAPSKGQQTPEPVPTPQPVPTPEAEPFEISPTKGKKAPF